jgi:hypothetical protein
MFFLAQFSCQEVELLQLSAAFAWEMVIICKDVIKYGTSSSALRQSALVTSNSTSASNDSGPQYVRRSHWRLSPRQPN